VWAAHVKICRELGYPQSVFDAIRAGATPQFDNERERTVYASRRLPWNRAAAPTKYSTALKESSAATASRRY
jgi:hypothetical protein